MKYFFSIIYLPVDGYHLFIESFLFLVLSFISKESFKNLIKINM